MNWTNRITGVKPSVILWHFFQWKKSREFWLWGIFVIIANKLNEAKLKNWKESEFEKMRYWFQYEVNWNWECNIYEFSTLLDLITYTHSVFLIRYSHFTSKLFSFYCKRNCISFNQQSHRNVFVEKRERKNNMRKERKPTLTQN